MLTHGIRIFKHQGCYTFLPADGSPLLGDGCRCEAPAPGSGWRWSPHQNSDFIPSIHQNMKWIGLVTKIPEGNTQSSEQRKLTCSPVQYHNIFDIDTNLIPSSPISTSKRILKLIPPKSFAGIVTRSPLPPRVPDAGVWSLEMSQSSR
jgi:hypothetical protein